MLTERKSETSPEAAPQVCSECLGRGWIDQRCHKPEKAHRCDFCNGKGVDTAGKPCYACHGTGLLEVRVEDKGPCLKCEGAGLFPVPESMKRSEYAFDPGRNKR